jgi:hypothetical protein
MVMVLYDAMMVSVGEGLRTKGDILLRLVTIQSIIY